MPAIVSRRSRRAEEERPASSAPLRCIACLASSWFLLFTTACASDRPAAPPSPPPPRPPPALPALGASPRPAVTPDAEEPPASAPSTAPVQEAAPAPSLASPHAPEPPARPSIGQVAGDPITAEELLVEWSDVASRDLYLLVDKLVSARLALAEAARLGIRLAPEAVEERFLQDKQRLADRIERSGKQRSLEEFIAKELGFEPERYLERVRRGTIRQMLAERAVRMNSLANENVAVRLIVAVDEARMKEAQDALAAGRDFAEVAREFSVDDSKEQGGLVPYVVAQERSPLARLAFQTPVGELAGPIPTADHQFLIRVEERRTPLQGNWPVLEQTVEASLAEHPVTDPEFVNWKLAMEGRYPIDLGPLWELVGAARE